LAHGGREWDANSCRGALHLQLVGKYTTCLFAACCPASRCRLRVGNDESIILKVALMMLLIIDYNSPSHACVLACHTVRWLRCVCIVVMCCTAPEAFSSMPLPLMRSISACIFRGTHVLLTTNLLLNNPKLRESVVERLAQSKRVLCVHPISFCILWLSSLLCAFCFNPRPVSQTSHGMACSRGYATGLRSTRNMQDSRRPMRSVARCYAIM